MEFAEFSPGSALLQTYLISGPAGSGKLAAAKTLAQAMVCSGEGRRPCGVCRDCRKAAAGLHPDIILVARPEGKREISVEQARMIRADAAVLPNEAARKAYIIRDADTMNAQAQNALLKTLEEPPRRASFILTAENPGRLLDTVRSRCAEIVMAPAGSDAEAHSEAAEALLDALLSGSRLRLAEVLSAVEKMDREEIAAYCTAVRRASSARLRTASAGVEKLAAAIAAMDEADRYLDANISAGSISGLLLARLL